MKGKLLMAIVLFVIGEMTRAQNLLLPGTALQADKQVAAGTMHHRAAGLFSEPNYWVAAQAHYDEYGMFSGTELTETSYKANVTINGTEATINGFMDFGYFNLLSEESVKGEYDPEAHTITISTPSYSEDRPVNEYTKLGTINYYGSEMTLVLFAGEFKYIEEIDSYGLDTENKLVFDVSDDLTTLTPRTGYGAYGFDDWGGGGFVNFFKTAKWMEIGDDARLLIQPESLHISGDNVTKGATLTREIMVSNIGKTATKVDVELVGDGLELPYNYGSLSLEGTSTQYVTLTFTPQTEGEFEGTVKFAADNGTQAELAVKATVLPPPDFSAVVKRGDLVFAMSDDYPFAITDTITGSPVAVSTNEMVDGSTSTLYCFAHVPEGKTGVLSWKGVSTSMQPNGASIYVNNTQVFNNVYNHMGELGKDDISNAVILTEGNNRVAFVNEVMLNWYNMGMSPEPFKTYVYDFDLQLVDNADHAAIAKDEQAEFGRHYIDKLDITDTTVVYLVNLGNQPLTVTGYEGDDNFSAVVDGVEAEYTRNLRVKLLFTADKPGDYNGTVTVKTNAGDFAFSCHASAENIATDYSPIVSKGDFSFNTSFEHPFVVEGHTATSSIAYMDMTNVGIVESWLEASFVVPEGEIGTLAWDGHNSSADYFDFMGNIQHNDGTIITIDGTTVKDYAGEMDASSTTFNADDLTFTAGLHKVKFLYRKVYSEGEGFDRFKLQNLSLKLADASGIGTVENNCTVVKREVFNASGCKLNSLPETGVYIIRETLSDGKVITRKMVH
ncbi:MAG: hypothetical protein ACI3YD_01580 [Alloprevotella sp.]